MKRARGFSLIELVTVMVLIGILAVSVSTRFDRGTFDSEAHAGELLTALRYAQEMAMTHTGSPALFQVVVSGSGFAVQRNDGGTITPVADPYTHAAGYGANWTDTTIAPATTVRFDGRGAPSWSGTLTVSVGGNATTVIVEPVTGYVH